MIDVPNYCEQALAGSGFHHQKVTALNINQFLQRDFPPRENMLAPWLGVSSLALMYAWRGTGKTLVAHGSAWAIACGGGFLNWTAPCRAACC